MKQYLVTYFGGNGMDEAMSMSQEERDTEMRRWMKWFEDNKANVVQMGSPFAGPETIVTKNGSETSDQGPSGYTVLQADSTDQLRTILANHPHMDVGSMHIHECIDMTQSN